VNANHFLVPMYRWHTGLVGLAEAAERTPQRVSEKSTLSVVLYKLSRLAQEVEGFSSKEPCEKGAH